MKKFTALVALALLAIAGTGYAVTCAQDNVPAATLLVPYFRVGGTGVVLPNDIPDTSGTDTLVAVTNVSTGNIIIHVTVWNKYSAGVLDFNIPMTGSDVVFFSMRNILNGHLNVNPSFQKLTKGVDPCGQNYDAAGMVMPGQSTKTDFIKFLPAAGDPDLDNAISFYADPAFGGAFRANVWTSLDESYDITNWKTKGSKGAGVIDVDNYACDNTKGGTVVAGDFSGYLTIDVMNYCTQHFADTGTEFWRNDPLATAGWVDYNGPNVLMGDVFFKDQTVSVAGGAMGNISGDPAVHIEFDSRLLWGTSAANGSKTFYGRYYDAGDAFAPLGSNDPRAPYSFPGDGREPLGNHYGFRYVATPTPVTHRTWIEVWRSDTYNSTSVKNLCSWWGLGTGANTATVQGFMDDAHLITAVVWDNDENPVGGSGGPSGGPGTDKKYIFLETQRLVVTGPGASTDIVPAGSWSNGGWIDLTLAGNFQNQSFVEVQHSSVGDWMSVGHSATLLDGQFVCNPQPLLTITGTMPTGIVDGHAAVQTLGGWGQ
jgi:hypothetical protein